MSDPAPQRRGKSRRREDTERERLFTLSLDLLCVCGFDAVFRQINPAFERVLGYSPAELTSRPFIEFVLEDDKEQSREEFRRCAAGGVVVTFENRFRHADGSSRWLQWNAAPDPEGQVIYAAARDITDKKGQAAELARLASIVESSNDAIVGMSLGGVVESWNAAAEEVFGYRAAEMQDKPMSLLVPPGHADHLKQHLDQIRRGQKITHYETIRRRQDGTVISVSLTLSPVRDVNGDVVGASLIARDITERKQAEKERLELLQQLQHALSRSKRLTGTIQYCTECKKVRGDNGRWIAVERYIDDYSDANPLPARCPDHSPAPADG
ncbi:MAG TPA: PAS domain S-box protein [Gemmatimonadales bacterium]